MKKSKKLFIIPTLAATATLSAGLTTVVSCSNNNGDIAIEKEEMEQKATEGGLAIYSFDFKGETLPDSHRFVNIQLTELEIHTDKPTSSNAISLLQVVGKDDIVIHQDGHFDIPVKFIDPEDLEATTTVKFQLKLRYRVAGVNHEVYINDLVIKYNTDGPKQKDEAQIVCLSDNMTTITGSIALPMEMIRDKDGYPKTTSHILNVACSHSVIMAQTPIIKSSSSPKVEFDQVLEIKSKPKNNTLFSGNLIYTYHNAKKDKNITVSVPFSFMYQKSIVVDAYIMPPPQTAISTTSFTCTFTVIHPTLQVPILATNIVIFDSEGKELSDMYAWSKTSTVGNDKTFNISISFKIEPARGKTYSFYLKANIGGKQLLTKKSALITYRP